MKSHRYQPDPTILPGLRDGSITQIVEVMEEKPSSWISWDDGSRSHLHKKVEGGDEIIRSPYQPGDTLDVMSDPPIVCPECHKDMVGDSCSDCVYERAIDFSLTITARTAVQVKDLTLHVFMPSRIWNRPEDMPSDTWLWLYTIERK